MKLYTSTAIFLTFAFIIFFNICVLRNNECYDFYSIPVLHDGRIKPLGTLIDYDYKSILKKYDNKYNSNARSLADLFFNPKDFLSKNMFKIDDVDIKNNLGLKNEKLFNTFDLFYAFEKNYELINKLLKINFNLLNNSQKEIVSIYHDVYLIIELSKLMDLVLVNDKIKEKSNGFIKTKYELVCNVNMPEFAFNKLINKSDININFFSPGENGWFSINKFFIKKELSKNIEIDLLSDISKNYFEKRFNDWNKNCNDYVKLIYKSLSFSTYILVKLEIIYNNLNLISNSILFFSFCIFMMFFLAKNVHSIVFFKKICFMGFLMLALDVIFRVILTQKSPVTSLHESIIFVNFVFTLYFFIYFFKTDNLKYLPISLMVSIFLSFISIKMTGDNNIKPVVAVLNTNFWLIIHVLTISVGYSLCLICGFLSHIYLYKIWNKSIDSINNSLYFYIFYIALLSLCFSFIGTLLGGIWADQSWGRFWGWDPKENGALLIVLWLTFVFHAKLSKLISEIIFCVGIVFNLIVLAFAWFGVNLLSVGLHSYGFTENIELGLIIYIYFECLFLFYFLFFYKKILILK